MSAPSPLEDLIDDINSKCSSLRDAGTLLRASTHAEERELLRLMTLQAQSLSKTISDYEKDRARR